MSQIFNTLATIVYLYSILCIIRIILTWIPSVKYNKVIQILYQATDPFLNIFRGLRFLTFRNIDFSPLVALACLNLVSSVFKDIATTKHVYLGRILSIIITMAWSIVSSVLLILIVIMIIRLIMLLLNKSQNQIWYSLDQTLQPITRFIGNLFFKNKTVSSKKLLIVSLITMIVLYIALRFVLYFIAALFAGLPF